MAWTPTKAVLTPRAIPDNILTWVTDATRQGDALTWAGATAGTRLLRTDATIAADRSKTPYPSIAFTDDNDEQVFGEDIIEARYECKFRVGVQATSVATALTNAKKYDAAIRSMIANCTTLATSTNAIAGTVVVQGIETGFLEIVAGLQGKATNDFLQQFEIRVTCSLLGTSNI